MLERRPGAQAGSAARTGNGAHATARVLSERDRQGNTRLEIGVSERSDDEAVAEYDPLVKYEAVNSEPPVKRNDTF